MLPTLLGGVWVRGIATLIFIAIVFVIGFACGRESA